MRVGFCWLVTGLFCVDIGLFCMHTGIFCVHIGLFCVFIGLLCGYRALFVESFRTLFFRWCWRRQTVPECSVMYVLQYAVIYSNVLQRVVACCSVLQYDEAPECHRCCSYVVCCIVLHCTVLQSVAVCCSVLPYVAVWWSARMQQVLQLYCVLQCVVACCGTLQNLSFWMCSKCCSYGCFENIRGTFAQT